MKKEILFYAALVLIVGVIIVYSVDKWGKPKPETPKTPDNTPKPNTGGGATTGNSGVEFTAQLSKATGHNKPITVTYLQNLLIQKGYTKGNDANGNTMDLKADGWYGDITQSAHNEAIAASGKNNATQRSINDVKDAPAKGAVAVLVDLLGGLGINV